MGTRFCSEENTFLFNKNVFPVIPMSLSQTFNNKKFNNKNLLLLWWVVAAIPEDIYIIPVYCSRLYGMYINSIKQNDEIINFQWAASTSLSQNRAFGSILNLETYLKI